MYYGSNDWAYEYPETWYRRKVIETDRQWVLHDSGSAGPHTGNWDKIFEAYHDKRMSQEWD